MYSDINIMLYYHTNMLDSSRRSVRFAFIRYLVNIFVFIQFSVVGASAYPASDVYAGPGPFSEPETLYLSRFISSIGDKIDMYLSFHSYGQMLIIPFGNTTEHLSNYYDAVRMFFI